MAGCTTGADQSATGAPERPHGSRRQRGARGPAVLDLTRVRSGPTCVRQLADWGADVIKIEAPGRRRRARRPPLRPISRTCTRNKPQPDARPEAPKPGHAAFRRLADTADVVVENFRPDVKGRLGIGYETLSGHQSRPDLRLDLRFRAGRALRRASRLPDQDRPGHGRAGCRSPASRATARCASASRSPTSARGLLARKGSSSRPPRAAALGARPVGPDLAPAGAGVHAGLPGGALPHGRRGPRAGRQQPPDVDPHRRVPHARRPHEHRWSRARASGRGSRGPWVGPTGSTIPVSPPRPPARTTATRSAPRSRRSRCFAPPRSGSRSSTRRAFPPARSTTSPRSSPTRKCAISGSPAGLEPGAR